MRSTALSLWIGVTLALGGLGCSLDRSGLGAATRPDGGAPVDGAGDAGAPVQPSDGGPLEVDDAAMAELDAGPAMPEDAGAPDAGPTDAGAPDAGPMDGGACAPGATDALVASRLASELTIDGRLGDWAGIPFVPIANWRGLGVTPPDRPTPSDISAEIAVAWTSTTLYVAVRVTDDVHVLRGEGPRYLFNGDSLQLGFDVGRNTDPASSAYDGVDDFEFGWSVGTSGSDRSYRWEAPTAVTARENAAGRRNADAGRTTYEIAFPAASLGLSAFASGSVMRMAALVNETDDATRLESVLEWGTGLASPKFPGRFPDLRLESLPPCPPSSDE